MSDTRYLQGPLWNNTYVVVMAGGIEGRFWPLGDETMPKQFLDVMGQGKTLLQMTVDRFAGRLCPVELNSPVILGVSEGAGKYMGGYIGKFPTNCY